MRFKKIGLMVAALVMASGSAFANEFEGQLRDLANGEFKEMASAAVVVDAVKAQNVASASLDQAAIDAADKAWRAETLAASKPTIDAVMSNPASAYLQQQKEASGGLITEIILMDNKGLNVALSDVSSDYWQGDEAKYQETYPKGAGAVHVSDVEQDESTQTFQSQVSFPVVDPGDGAVIGAMTVGVNVEMLGN